MKTVAEINAILEGDELIDDAAVATATSNELRSQALLGKKRPDISAIMTGKVRPEHVGKKSGDAQRGVGSEKRREAARARWAKVTPEERREHMHLANPPSVHKATCPHCGKTGYRYKMKRHFDKCKLVKVVQPR